MSVRIMIDLNVRVRGNKTYSGFEDIQGQRNFGRGHLSDADGPVAIGDKVLAVEPYDRIVTDAEVVDIDHERELVYLAVDWRGFRDDEPDDECDGADHPAG